MSNRQSDRAFGLTMAAVFAIITAVSWLGFESRQLWTPSIAAGFLVTSVAVPWLLLPLNRLWAAFAHRLGKINNFILLSVFFYLFVLPMALILRLVGHDPMRRQRDSTATTYWTPVTRRTDSETLRDMF